MSSALAQHAPKLVRAPSRIGVTVDPKSHPLVHLLFAKMKEQQISVSEMERRSGVSEKTMVEWARRPTRTVTLFLLESCLGVVGVEIVAKEPAA